MSDWGAGYITDVVYTATYYPSQSPYHLAAACLLRSVRPPPVGAGLSYLELGCGRGYGALVLAAGNPDWTVTAVDFNPAHIAEARLLARQAGLDNIHFLEADLADPATIAALPEADIATLHGLWSWVDVSVRAGIVAVLKARLRPGGLVQVSYNSLPGWQGALGLHRVLREAGLRGGSSSAAQAAAGMRLVQDLAAADALYLQETRVVRTHLETARTLPPEYLAHEHMNRAWSPCFHMDVCADLAPARLQWAGTTSLIASFPELSLTPEQRALVDRYDEPVMRELIADMCVERGLRNDVFVRGLTRLGQAERDEALRGLTLALRVPRSSFRFAVTVPGGEAAMEPAVYGPVADRLAQAPCTVAALLDLPALRGRGYANPAELVGMLVGSGQAMTVRGGPPRDEGRANALNHAINARHEADGTLNVGAAIASATLGCGLPCSMLELAVWSRLARTGALDPAATANRLMAHGSNADRARMVDIIAAVARDAPAFWRGVGVSPLPT